MKKLIGTVMAHPVGTLVFVLRVAAVGLFYGGIHWLAWQHLSPRHAWMVDGWLASGVILGVAFVVMHRWMPQHAETAWAILCLLVGALGLAIIPGEIARALPHVTLLRSIEAVCKVLAVLVVAAGVSGMVLEQSAKRTGRGRGA